MGELSLKRRVKIAAGCLCLFLIGLAIAVVIIAVKRNSLVVLVPFALATLVSFGAIWWARHCHGKIVTSPPVGAWKQGIK